MDKNYDVIVFISKCRYRKDRVANFADIIKVTIMFIEITFKDLKKSKRIRDYLLK